jgi:hypothetical protein
MKFPYGRGLSKVSPTNSFKTVRRPDWMSPLSPSAIKNSDYLESSEYCDYIEEEKYSDEDAIDLQHTIEQQEDHIKLETLIEEFNKKKSSKLKEGV